MTVYILLAIIIDLNIPLLRDLLSFLFKSQLSTLIRLDMGQG